MKRGKTRKNNRRRNMYGGQVTPPPYASTAINATILTKLQNLDQDTLILKGWADQYKTITDTLNDTVVMSQHLTVAQDISDKADDVYARAQALWTSIYGTPWVPPPAAAPAPV
jgi:hypothetical protein